MFGSKARIKLRNEQAKSSLEKYLMIVWPVFLEVINNKMSEPLCIENFIHQLFFWTNFHVLILFAVSKYFAVSVNNFFCILGCLC